MYCDYFVFLTELKNSKHSLDKKLELAKSFFKNGDKYGFEYIEKI